VAEVRTAIRALPGLDALDGQLTGAPGVAAYDPLRLAVDVRGTGATGYEVASLVRELDDVYLELAADTVVVAVFGMGEPAAQQGARLAEALRRAVSRLGEGERRREAFAEPPPWGELALTPREAFLGPQEVVPVERAAGRVAAESLAAYPPGIPNVLPGERLSAETLAYVQDAVARGGSVRGASDRTLHTLRVAVEE
jgi:lysine decarboxylase